MPQIHKTYISVGNRMVGSAWVDGGALRGEGGPLHPQLVVPLTIRMENAPADAMVAVVAVRATLLTQPSPTPDAFVAQPTSELLMKDFAARSLPAGTGEHVTELRFFLTRGDVEASERHRHAVDSDPFQLYLGLEVVVAGLRTFNQLEPGRPMAATPWEPSFGMFSELLPFWSTKVDPVTVSIERSKWVREVLPGLGHDQSRLIEITFPPPLPEHRSAASEWDKARRAFDEQRYADCVSECRDILAMWQRELGASKDRRLATAVAQQRGWDSEDGRLVFLDCVWKATTDLVNVPHHPEGRASEQSFDAADARLVLLLTASLSAYLRG